MKIEDIKCVVEGVTYQAVEAHDGCDGCAFGSYTLACEKANCMSDAHFVGSPSLIWKEAPGDEDSLRAYIHYHEYDFSKEHPTLVIQGDFGSCGYVIDITSGELTRTCICHASEDTECCCGGFE